MGQNSQFLHHNSSQRCYDNSGINLPNEQQQLFDNLIWGIDEVSRFTEYTKGTIYNLVSEGDIPYRKRRGRLKFIPNEILKWMKGEL
jgi:predicted DNA-binding transcriptional regulator AlpA